MNGILKSVAIDSEGGNGIAMMMRVSHNATTNDDYKWSRMRRILLNTWREYRIWFVFKTRLVLTVFSCYSLHDPPGGVHQQHQLSEEVGHRE